MTAKSQINSTVERRPDTRQRVQDVAGFAHYLAETAKPEDDPGRLAAALLECADEDEALLEAALRFDRVQPGTHDRAEMLLDRAAHSRAA
jgi:hypothetical protein